MSIKVIAQDKTPVKNHRQVLPSDRNLHPLQPNTWVHLQELPSPYSFSEALLLCPEGQDHWLVWIPDHGEAVLPQQYLLAA